ncbi:CDP-diacylglycerol--serine O-phosphatidyltransferase [Mycolicibacterium insubricum]|uniref:CDP-diacylglycerol--serine O-phosphatidyltransferase n=1 Tax=Mycolicibacterium insubricum TaxID=444597 RepID=A0A1X0CL01_9MYCO|nr:phosphatidylcholine/phosphatidylserine synthase [Mycolicibacterium insubricum]ORA60788.1 CDP-diacylglycerol--serine O-phosphatidyltransferase [Mycolicibacterium insubricum]BBZ65627.1 CDP-diacylglycerol--serine O-phosphatidyltransferase [Mycolicibacterium insubricum]
MKPRLKPQDGLRILPSAMTVAAICFGLSAVKLCVDAINRDQAFQESRYTVAMAFLAVAAILDALDGRAARMLNATSKMGEEIDSLADAVNFGVAPAFIVYLAIFNGTGLAQVGWVVALLYAVCIVLRLARFNARLHGDKPAYEQQFFTGMPAPAGAIGAIGPLAAKLQFPGDWWTSPTAQWVVAGWMIGVSLLVVSAIPMRKIHTFAVPRQMAVPLLALLALFIAAAIQYGYLVILLIIAAYVIHIPFAVRSRAWLADHPEVWDDKPKQQRQARRAIRRAQHPNRRVVRRSAGRLGLRRPGGQ